MVDIFMAKHSHRFAYLCLDNVQMYKSPEPISEWYVETRSSATRTLFRFKYLEFHSK